MLLAALLQICSRFLRRQVVVAPSVVAQGPMPHGVSQTLWLCSTCLSHVLRSEPTGLLSRVMHG